MTTDARALLTDDAAQHPLAFQRAFNSGDADALDQLYEDGGVLVGPAGAAVTGAERCQANAALMAFGVPIRVTPRHVYVHDDLALLVVDWCIAGTGGNGQQVDISGTATDVARRGSDGLWRYVIDNPWGAAEPPFAGTEPNSLDTDV